jgi:hypothetical protein
MSKELVLAMQKQAREHVAFVLVSTIAALVAAALLVFDATH